MCVELPQLRIVYMPIPKAACSSVKAALASIDENSPITLEDIQNNDLVVHEHYKTSRHRPHRWEPYCDGTWWRFSVVRDPLKRLLSVYTNRVVALRELHNSRRIRAQSALTPDPDPDFFFQNLKEYMALSSSIKHHALPAWLFIGPQPINFDRIYRTDELGLLADDLSEKAGKQVTIPKLNKSEKSLEIGDLNAKTVDFLREHLAPQYEHLSDYYRNPFEKRSRSVSVT
ncbi:sulfotransferase family 2 domain-containing protein [Sagittula sp. SSi028]|uniref:sulfotransferase family 2 domain-containing protein n=1 Tax=Sagittula sp. SSi028 TaxID=3400636 RepID=UPI003AF71453